MNTDEEIIDLRRRVETLEKLVKILFTISRETEALYPYTSPIEQQFVADFWDRTDDIEEPE